jgi:hypothetical protein
VVHPDRAPDPAPEVPGYALGELLGRGALGTVWSATRVTDGQPVAVKVVSVAGEEAARVLARELAVLGRVAVDGLVGFHEAVGLAGDRPAVALVLDLLTGGSLERAVQARGHLSVGESVTVLAPVARALAGLHALGVVHGDVSPANVLLERSGRPFLADLGVARRAGALSAGRSGWLWGTPGFVAPEVFDEGVPTAAADVYAVGALAWWCVTGAVPETGPVRRPLAEVAPGLPSAWSAATTQALVGDPALRPSAAELALAYFDAADCEPLRMVVGGDETALLTQRLRRLPAAPVQAPPAPRRRIARSLPAARAGGVATLVGLVAVLGVGGLVAADVLDAPGWLGPGRHGPRPTPATTRDLVATTRAEAPATDSTSTSATVVVTADAATDPTAPQRDPRALMMALAAARAAAMNAGSTAALAELDVPGSDALARDTELIADLVATGTSWHGVRFEVTSAHTVAGGSQTATVDAVVGTAAYRVVGRSGQEQTRAAVPGRPLRFELAWSGGRWRVDRVTETDG